MDQLKIGKFISKCRKDINLTQAQLAEKLNITDRAVSKWENGRSLPDASIMLDLCNILNISVNELLIGEKIDMNEKENEEKLKELLRGYLAADPVQTELVDITKLGLVELTRKKICKTLAEQLTDAQLT